jgi:hypothetical protein
MARSPIGIDRPLKTRRAWISLLYVLATVVAQGLHDHGPRTEGSAAVGLPSCNDPHPHFAGHGAPEVLRGDLDCLACQFRAEHQADATTSVALPIPARRLATVFAAPRVQEAASSRPICRGPPLA